MLSCLRKFPPRSGGPPTARECSTQSRYLHSFRRSSRTIGGPPSTPTMLFLPCLSSAEVEVTLLNVPLFVRSLFVRGSSCPLITVAALLAAQEPRIVRGDNCASVCDWAPRAASATRAALDARQTPPSAPQHTQRPELHSVGRPRAPPPRTRVPPRGLALHDAVKHALDIHTERRLPRRAVTARRSAGPSASAAVRCPRTTTCRS